MNAKIFFSIALLFTFSGILFSSCKSKKHKCAVMGDYNVNNFQQKTGKAHKAMTSMDFCEDK